MMTMTRWNPFEELTNLHRDMDRLFGRHWSEESPASVSGTAFVPATEVRSNAEALHVLMALPGIDPKDVQIELTGSTITVRGERRSAAEAFGDAHLTEIGYGKFERSLTVPKGVDGAKVSATYQNGMLELTLPFAESVKPRRIEIARPDIQAFKVA